VNFVVDIGFHPCTSSYTNYDPSTLGKKQQDQDWVYYYGMRQRRVQVIIVVEQSRTMGASWVAQLLQFEMKVLLYRMMYSWMGLMICISCM